MIISAIGNRIPVRRIFSWQENNIFPYKSNYRRIFKGKSQNYIRETRKLNFLNFPWNSMGQKYVVCYGRRQHLGKSHRVWSIGKTALHWIALHCIAMYTLCIASGKLRMRKLRRRKFPRIFQKMIIEWNCQKKRGKWMKSHFAKHFKMSKD